MPSIYGVQTQLSNMRLQEKSRMQASLRINFPVQVAAKLENRQADGGHN
jgi:hypothetical protein